MTAFSTIKVGDAIHSDWYGNGTVLDLNQTGNGKIKFGSHIIIFMVFEVFYDNGWMLSV
jgi:hypothetical protein